jgi:CDP-glucose 4,6-dehydratase
MVRDFWIGKGCLITGGYGFGRSHSCEQLFERGTRVYVLDREATTNSYLATTGLGPRIHYLYSDVGDLELVKISLEWFKINTIFHLVAQPSVPINSTFRYEVFSINVMGTYSILEAMRNSSFTKNFVFASSGAFYGTITKHEPITEDHPSLVAANVYTPATSASGIVVRYYAKTYGIKAAARRFINTYGPGNTNLSTIVPATVNIIIIGLPSNYLNICDMTTSYLAVVENTDSVR